jgi:uncharacterized membrane-anchored protein YitT (DUF2179 family)
VAAADGRARHLAHGGHGGTLPDPVSSAPAAPIPTPVPASERHSLFEDAQALLIASAFVALGYGLLGHLGLLTGGTAGLALLLTRLTPFTFGQLFLALNVPFFWLGVRAMGWAFTAKTFLAIGLVSFATDHLDTVIVFEHVHPVAGAAVGGFLIGAGLLMLFRHQACLGGLNILAIWLQRRRRVRAGIFQMIVDSVVVLASLFVVSPAILALSVLGAVALNMVLAVNHRPGRYLGT